MILNRRFYIALSLIILLLGSGYTFAPLFVLGQWMLFIMLLAVLAEGYMLYRIHGIQAFRQCSSRFSNGDENTVNIRVESSYPYAVSVEVIDEIPFIFQQRNINFQIKLQANEGKTISYQLRPTHRGIYNFGRIRVFVQGRMGLLSRRYTCGDSQDVKVYPSYLMLHRYELLAISDNLTELGIKRIRRVGHHTEFEQIKEYVKGDDYRTINWKASARKHELMVNVYQDERSQQIYSVIDKGRVMQQAFRGMTLLDYAVNASLVLSYVAMQKEDKAGLITFDEHFDTFVPASSRPGHMQTLLENLYNQETTFSETDFSSLCVHLNKHVNKRSLLVLYTNFSSMGSMNRQLAYLQQLNRQHRLLVVFFEDADLKAYLIAEIRKVLEQTDAVGTLVFNSELTENAEAAEIAEEFHVSLGRADWILTASNKTGLPADEVARMSLDELLKFQEASGIVSVSVSKFISLEEAKKIALKDAKLDELTQKIVFTREELNRNQGKPCYLLEFYTGTNQYFYQIDAKSGSIIYAGKFITLSEAKKIALDDAGCKDKVSFTEETLVSGGIKTPYYRLVFADAKTQWTYRIDAVLGIVLEKKQKETATTEIDTADFISLEEAKKISLKDAGLDEAAQKIVFTREELNRNSGKPCYILEFYTDKCAYSYKVDAVSGDITGKKTDWFSRQESETVPGTSQNSDSKQRRTG